MDISKTYNKPYFTDDELSEVITCVFLRKQQFIELYEKAKKAGKETEQKRLFERYWILDNIQKELIDSGIRMD